MGAKPKKNGSISYAKWGYIFIAPFFLIFAVFQLIPLQLNQQAADNVPDTGVLPVPRHR